MNRHGGLSPHCRPLIAAQSQRGFFRPGAVRYDCRRRGINRGRPCRRGRPVLRKGTTVPVPRDRRCRRCSSARPSTRKLLQPRHHLHGFEIQIPNGLTATFCSGSKAEVVKLPVSSAAWSADAAVRGSFGAYCGGSLWSLRRWCAISGRARYKDPRNFDPTTAKTRMIDCFHF